MEAECIEYLTPPGWHSPRGAVSFPSPGLSPSLNLSPPVASPWLMGRAVASQLHRTSGCQPRGHALAFPFNLFCIKPSGYEVDLGTSHSSHSFVPKPPTDRRGPWVMAHLWPPSGLMAKCIHKCLSSKGGIIFKLLHLANVYI